MARRRKKRSWEYHKIKIKPGEFLSGTLTRSAGDLCKPFPQNSTVYEFETYCGNYEYIDYYIKSKPYVEQPCFHIKNTVDRYAVPSYSYNTVATHRCSDGTYKTTYSESIVDGSFFGMSARLADGYRLPDLPDLNQCHREAIEFFASGCQPITANWAVNLIEITQLIDLAKTAYKALKLFKKLAASQIPYSFGMLLRRLQRMNSDEYVGYLSKNLSKEAANAFLAYNFAISPLLSDIRATAETLNSLSNRIAYFRKNNKIPVKVNFSKDLSDAFPVEPTSFPPVEDIKPDKHGVNIFRTQYKAKYTASAYASYDVSGLSDNDIAYKLAKQAFGFADPLVLLWEIIPFSFVIDWVFKVGDYIASLPSLSTFPYVLSRVTHSLSVQQTNTYLAYGYIGKLYTPRIAYRQPVFTDIISYYKRDLGLPITFSGMDASLPGFQQLMLALALGRQFFK